MQSTNDLLSRVSAGKALCGIYVTEDASTLSADTDQVIKCPTEIKLLDPSLEVKQDTLEIDSKDQQNAFSTSLASMGVSLAAKVAGKGWSQMINAEGSASHKTKATASTRQTNENVFISKHMFLLIPTHAIRLNQEHMKLEDSVLRDLKAIEESLTSKTPSNESLKFITNSAQELFKRYGTHINRGILHLGGVYVQSGSYECHSRDKDEKAEDMVLSAVKSNFTAGFNALGCKADVSLEFDCNLAKRELTDEFDRSKLSKILIRVLKQGGSPTANSIDEWKESLQHNYAIIDRGTDFERGFCGIWELIQNHSSCFSFPKGLALFLKYTWCSLHGNLNMFMIDSEDHANQFIQMMLVEKYSNTDLDEVTAMKDAHPIVQFIQICKEVIGENNSTLQTIVADIEKHVPQVKETLQMLYGPFWTTVSPEKGEQFVVGGALLVRNGVRVTVTNHHFDSQVDVCLTVANSDDEEFQKYDYGDIVVAQSSKDSNKTTFNGLLPEKPKVLSVVASVVASPMVSIFYNKLLDMRMRSMNTSLRGVISASLHRADKDMYSSIIFPGRPGGKTNFPCSRIVEAFFEEMARFIDVHRKTTIRDIYIDIPKDDKEIERAFEEMIRSILENREIRPTTDSERKCCMM